jgi:recombination protein RecA
MVRIKCTKNKVGVVNREVSVEFTYGMGYTIEADVASSAKRLGILEMKGSWVSYKGTNLCQGIDNVIPMLFDNPELLEELKNEIKEKVDIE